MDLSFYGKPDYFSKYRAAYTEFPKNSAETTREKSKRQPQIERLPHFMLVALVPVDLSANNVDVGI